MQSLLFFPPSSSYSYSYSALFESLTRSLASLPPPQPNNGLQYKSVEREREEKDEGRLEHGSYGRNQNQSSGGGDGDDVGEEGWSVTA